MNSVHLMGNLTADPDLRTFDENKRVVNFTVAVNRRYKKKDKSTGQDTTFVPCEAWDSGADLIAKYFKKGEPIIVVGALLQENWDDKETGNKRSRLKCRVERFHFLPSKGNRNSEEDGEEKPARRRRQNEDQADAAVVGEEDIPF